MPQVRWMTLDDLFLKLISYKSDALELRSTARPVFIHIEQPNPSSSTTMAVTEEDELTSIENILELGFQLMGEYEYKFDNLLNFLDDPTINIYFPYSNEKYGSFEINLFCYNRQPDEKRETFVTLSVTDANGNHSDSQFRQNVILSSQYL